MSNKIHDYGEVNSSGQNYHSYGFHCPGCGYEHAFSVGHRHGPLWDWNGSFDKPTFNPSLLCNQHEPKSRCHSFVREGKIQFLTDCWHHLAGQTVDLPDWEGWDSMPSRVENIRKDKD